ncbi:MAG: flagellar hook-associated protein FlgK [Pseudomonadota bacterium]
MSISSTLAGAIAGLGATARAADVVANNIANVETPGYARRSLAVTSTVAGGLATGVRVLGVEAASDPRATADRRRVEAEAGAADILSRVADRFAAIVGAPGEAGALASRAQAFEIAVQALADTPESPALQAQMLTAAQDFAASLNTAGTEAARIRTDADAAIARGVASVNDSLERIDRLNEQIRLRTAQSQETAGLEDQRRALLDRLNEQIPIRTVRNEVGQIAIYSAGGETLLDREVFPLDFQPTATITQDMTLASGALSGLTIGGRPISAGTGTGPLDGGALGAQFQVRDSAGLNFGAQIDALAADMIGRLQDPAVDGTRRPGSPGLFTDGGGAFDPADIDGVATRIAVNAAVDPAEGGALWRLRDGLQAGTPGPAGNDTLLRDIQAALAATAPAPAGLSGDYGAADLSAAISAEALRVGALREEEATYRAGQLAIFRDAELGAVGVDTDQELQRLLAIEKAYAANAKVIEVVDDLLRRILEVT